MPITKVKMGIIHIKYYSIKSCVHNLLEYLNNNDINDIFFITNMLKVLVTEFSQDIAIEGQQLIGKSC